MNKRASTRANPAGKRDHDFDDVRKSGPAYVTVQLPIADAERMQLGLADLLCWVRGFKAACPDATERHPLGEYETRDVRDAINRALERARGDEPKPMPF